MSDDFVIVYDRRAIEKLFEGPGGPVAKDLERRAIRVRNAAVRVCPVDTGRLRSSITYETGRDSRGLVARIGTNVEYAAHVEFGTGRMRAQPYLRPSLDAAR
jgi:HK97 gp10 family phage protein